jgi:hypothetical protein
MLAFRDVLGGLFGDRNASDKQQRGNAGGENAGFGHLWIVDSG